jgi:serine/threonine protein kinase
MMFCNYLAALQALHDRQVVHGDLNAQNVLVASNAMAQIGMTAKLADLGLSRMLVQCKTHHSTSSMGTLSHMPPGNMLLAVLGNI